MEKSVLLEKIRNIKVCKSNDVRAPHKPLLILYALGRYLNEHERVISYLDYRSDMIQLLKEFGRPLKTQNPQEPFYRLKNDGIWELNQLNHENKVSDSWLKKNNVTGMFSQDLIEILEKDPSFASEIIESILTANFPETLYDDVLIETGLMNAIVMNRVEVKRNIIPRDYRFRSNVLEVYNSSCAICNYNLILDSKSIGVEAAHIKWHTLNGPSSIDNGIALCAIHHKLFDQGAFMLDDNLKVHVSDKVAKNKTADIWLGQYEERQIFLPNDLRYVPNDDFVQWHVREVFRG